MRRSLPTRRALRHHLAVHRAGLHWAQDSVEQAVRASDLFLAILIVLPLGGLALSASRALATAA